MYLSKQELRACAGNLILCGFDGQTLGPELRELLRETRPLGLVLFKRNIESPQAAGELCHEVKRHVQRPLLMTVDQEGGRVARLGPPLTAWPPMRQLGARGDVNAARAVGTALARELRALHFDINFAPVLDVDTNPKNPVIGDRSLSRHPAEVASLGAALIEGMQSAGVGACAKHFPGHGDTDLDSHLALPHVAHDLTRLRQVEWPPFAAAIAQQVSSIMTAHVVMHAVDASIPATLSQKVLQTHLRQELGFAGVVVSDDIEMKALADHYDAAEVAQRGLRAGIDVFLACHAPAVVLGVYRGLVVAAEQDSGLHQALYDASARATAWQKKYYQPPAAGKVTLAFGEHAQLAARLA